MTFKAWIDQVMSLFRALDQEATMREAEEAQLQQCPCGQSDRVFRGV